MGYTGNDFVLPVDLSYEVDLWGRVRRSFRAAREQAQASAAAYQNVLLSLQADVAQTYFMIRSIDLDRHVVAETIELRKKNLALVESLHQGGADSAVDVAQAETELATAQADLVGLDLSRAQLENALGVLCGQTAVQFFAGGNRRASTSLRPFPSACPPICWKGGRTWRRRNATWRRPARALALPRRLTFPPSN